MGFKYARTGPPFNFLGTITESQKEALEKWVGKHKADFPDLTKFHQIRAHQLRKASGMLETFYKSKDPWSRGLEPSFEKDPWQPGPDGHFFPTQRDDQGPANAVFELRDRFQYPMAFDEEGQFRMNFLRTRFEFQEDLAQEMAEAADYVVQKLADLNRYFADPHYRASCIRDKSDLFEGEPRFRAHPWDQPTKAEQQAATGVLPKS